MKRINISLTDKQYLKVKQIADRKELKPGTLARLAILTAAKIDFLPDEFILPAKIKQTELFLHERKN